MEKLQCTGKLRDHLFPIVEQNQLSETHALPSRAFCGSISLKDPGLATPGPPGNWLEMHILGPFCRPTEADTPQAGLSDGVQHTLRWCQRVPRSENR